MFENYISNNQSRGRWTFLYCFKKTWEGFVDLRADLRFFFFCKQKMICLVFILDFNLLSAWLSKQILSSVHSNVPIYESKFSEWYLFMSSHPRIFFTARCRFLPPKTQPSRSGVTKSSDWLKEDSKASHWWKQNTELLWIFVTFVDFSQKICLKICFVDLLNKHMNILLVLSIKFYEGHFRKKSSDNLLFCDILNKTSLTKLPKSKVLWSIKHSK